MRNDLLKLTFVHQSTAEYLRKKFRDNPDSHWSSATPGVYIGINFSNDFLTRRWFHNAGRVLSDPFNIGFFTLIGVMRSKSWAPREVAGNVGGELLGALVVFLIFALPWLGVALLLDLLFLLPYMIFNLSRYRKLHEHARQKVIDGGGSLSEYEEELKRISAPLTIELENAVIFSRPIR